MPLNVPGNVRLTAEGMIRHFGRSALKEAQAVAARMGDKTPDGRDLWLAVAREIRAMQAGSVRAGASRTGDETRNASDRTHL